MEPLLMIKDLTKEFGKNRVLEKVSINLNAGEILGLIGPKNAGKSILLKILAGLVKPTSGQINIFGKELSQLEKADKEKISYIPDQANLYESMTVNEIIGFSKKFYSNWDEQKCSQLLKRFELPLNFKIKTLPRAMKTQLSLVLSLASRPDLLLMDEPLEGLTIAKRKDFINLLNEEFTEKKFNLIMVSQYLEDLEKVCQRIGLLREGRLCGTLSIEQLKVKKVEKLIRVVFRRRPPAYLMEMPGVKKVERETDLCYVFTINENFTEIYESCTKVPHLSLDVDYKDCETLAVQTLPLEVTNLPEKKENTNQEPYHTADSISSGGDAGAF